MNRTLRIAALLAAALPAAALASTWNVDPAHTRASFAVKHLAISTVRGDFGKTTGVLQLDDADVTKSSVEATIDATTIDTRVAQRDNHLKSPDFFDVAKHPTITFKSTKVEKAGEGKLKVSGDLTIRGNTRPVVLDVEGPSPEIVAFGEAHRAFVATTRINRKDFGLNWSGMVEATAVVADSVAIELSVEVIKAK